MIKQTTLNDIKQTCAAILKALERLEKAQQYPPDVQASEHRIMVEWMEQQFDRLRGNLRYEKPSRDGETP